MKVKWHAFEEEEECESEESDVEDEIEYLESEAAQLIQKGDIAIIRTNDNHSYYLAMLHDDIF